jgi:hypothetical protein
MPIMIATWEAELRFEASLGRKKLARLSLKNETGIVLHIYNPRYTGGGSRRIVVPGGSRKSMRPFLKGLGI